MARLRIGCVRVCSKYFESRCLVPVRGSRGLLAYTRFKKAIALLSLECGGKSFCFVLEVRKVPYPTAVAHRSDSRWEAGFISSTDSGECVVPVVIRHAPH